jgi:hypothetical protein
MTGVIGGWDGDDRHESQSGYNPRGARLGDNATGAMSGPGQEGNPRKIDPSVVPRNSARRSPVKRSVAKPALMRITLIIPEDEYKAWESELPDFVRIRTTEVLDNDERARLGL